MSDLTLVYPERLGDILQMLPCAMHLHKMGMKVDIHCKPQYHSLFDCVDYTQPSSCQDVGQVLNLAIWPDRYNEYRVSGVPWKSWIYGQFNLWCMQRGVPPMQDGQIRFTHIPPKPETLPNKYALISPYGHSQITKWRTMQLVGALESIYPTKGLQYAILSEQCGETMFPTFTAADIPELISTIAYAEYMITINSAPTYIASAVRKEYIHVIQPDFNLQDDFWHPAQIRVVI